MIFVLGLSFKGTNLSGISSEFDTNLCLYIISFIAIHPVIAAPCEINIEIPCIPVFDVTGQVPTNIPFQLGIKPNPFIVKSGDIKALWHITFKAINPRLIAIGMKPCHPCNKSICFLNRMQQNGGKK
jgi:hypothetical protein